MKPAPLRPQAVLILVVMLWGSTFVATKYVLEHQVPPLLYMSARYLLGSIVMVLAWPFLERTGGKRLSLFHGLFGKALVLGLLQTLGLVLQVLGQRYTTASKSAFLTAFSIPLIPLLGWFFYRERPQQIQLGAICVGVSGLFLLTYPEHGLSFNRGDLLTLACAVVYGVTLVQTTRWSKVEHAVRLATGQTAVATVMMLFCLALAYVLPLDAFPSLSMKTCPSWHLSLPLILIWIYMSVVCIALTFSLQLWSMSQMSATQAAVIFALEPVFATGMALLAFGLDEFPKTRGVVGAGLILIAVLLSEIRLRRKVPKEFSS